LIEKPFQFCYFPAMQSLRLNYQLSFFLLAVFLLHALIPAGYMPDLHSLQSGTFKVTICTGNGSEEVPFAPVHPQKNHKAPSICAFSGVSAPIFEITQADLTPPDFISENPRTDHPHVLAFAIDRISLARAPPIS
jgi:hypothetical protein